MRAAAMIYAMIDAFMAESISDVINQYQSYIYVNLMPASVVRAEPKVSKHRDFCPPSRLG
jgi:hypothetical protein